MEKTVPRMVVKILWVSLLSLLLVGLIARATSTALYREGKYAVYQRTVFMLSMSAES